MRHLNYSHLQYFWAVAREGSIAKASQSLHLTPQTISGQLKLLDEAVGQPLFNRVGRRFQPLVGPRNKGTNSHERAISRFSFCILRVIIWRLSGFR